MVMKILRDPLWQFIGVVIAVVAIVIGIVTSGGSGNSNQSASQPTPSTPRITAQQNMDIRNGPGTNFDRIAVLNTGDHLDILGISDDDRWYQVLLPDGNTGWVVAASSAGEVSGPLGALAVIVPTNTPTSTPTRTPTATDEPTSTPTANDTSEPTATETQAPTATPTQTDSPTSTTAPSDTPQLPTDTPTVYVTPTETQETAVETPEVVAGASQDGECPSQFGIEMVFIPATSFMMGSDIGPSNERPVREVTVDDFCIDVFEVTNTQYTRCVNDGVCTAPRRLNSRTVNDYYESAIHGRFPAVNVTWQQAQAYCEYRGGRLPTEAEWELVARYDPETEMMRTFPWGRQAADTSKANYEASIFGDTVEGGQHPSGISPFGVHDLSGNVAEWVFDWFGPYRSTDVDNPVGSDEGTARVVRGGSFDSSAEEIRGGYRDSQSPDVISDQVGFRCVIQ
jgi:formylglycine-generating enzyme required for sulfatase activity